MSDRTSVYIAAPWRMKEQARGVRALLDEAGFKVTSRWLDRPDNATDDARQQGYYGDTDHRGTPAEVDFASEAVLDWEDVSGSSLLFLCNWEKSEGKTIETGIALEIGLPIIAVGKPTNVFHYLSPEFVWFGTVEEAVEYAKRYL